MKMYHAGSLGLLMTPRGAPRMPFAALPSVTYHVARYLCNPIVRVTAGFAVFQRYWAFNNHHGKKTLRTRGVSARVIPSRRLSCPACQDSPVGSHGHRVRRCSRQRRTSIANGRSVCCPGYGDAVERMCTQTLAIITGWLWASRTACSI